MLGIIGKKVGMTTIFDGDGASIACTLIDSDECVVVQKKTSEKDGYNAVQLGYGDKKKCNFNKSEIGHFKQFNSAPKLRVSEFRDFDKDVAPGDILHISDVLSEGDMIDVTGESKGKGFQGVVKRHGFSGVGGATHGQCDRLRAPGSVGASSSPSRVFKGLRMAGHMGCRRVTVKDLKVLKIIDNHVLIVNGCVPGYNGSILLLRKYV